MDSLMLMLCEWLMLGVCRGAGATEGFAVGATTDGVIFSEVISVLGFRFLIGRMSMESVRDFFFPTLAEASRVP
jgi:hypothetical protein